MKNKFPTLQRFLISTVSSLLIFSAANSYADDTEIFFGGPAIDSGIRPNVLFVLDNSGSMAWRLTSDNNPSAGEPSRMESLKSAFSDIMLNASGINVGVMQLNTRTAYPRTMVAPIEYIDKELATNAEQVTAPEMLQSGDDAHMNGLATGSVVINSQTLPLGANTGSQTVNHALTVYLANNDTFNLSALSSNGNLTRNNTGKVTVTNNTNVAALYFRDLGIPKEATSVSVSLILNPASTSSNNTASLRLSAEKLASGAYFNNGTTLGPKNYTATLSSSQGRWSTGTARTINITSMITEIQNSITAGESVGNLALFIENTTSGTNFAREICTPTTCNTTSAPRLSITYNTTAAIGESKTAGIRFQNVGIPQGATITSATLNFVPAADGAAPAPTLIVKGQAVDDAAVYDTTANSLSASSRTRTSASVRWIPDEWRVTNPPVLVEGPNITSIVQEIVNRSGWCGNNSMAFYIQPETDGSLGLRTAASFDAGGGRQPQLVVNYTTGATPGCLNPIIETRIASNKSDGYEAGTNVNLVSETLPLSSGNVIGARFEGLPIAKDATILDARLILTAANDSTVNQTVAARVQTTISNAPAFVALDGDIEGRTGTSLNFPTIGTWVSGQEYRSADIKAGIQSVVNSADWAPRNAIAVLLRTGGSTGAQVVAYESNPAQSMRLRIKLQSGGLSSSTRTVRNQLNATVQAFTAKDGTPIVPTIYDAARYFRGELPGFDSPITSACQTSHMVLLTDGAANGNGAQSSINSLIGSSCTGDSRNGDEQCGRSLVEWMRTTDQSPNIANSDNYVTTHTVAFAPDAAGANTAAQIRSFLTALADKGGGSYNQANSAGDLAKVFNKIYQDVLSTDTTFVSPGATVNQFNRQTNKNEIYFALFKPTEDDRWPGNLKRYKLTNNTGAVILDEDGDVAIDPATGFFYSDARSYWSAQADGDRTADGGAASRIPSSTTRNVLTYIGTSPTAPVDINSTAHQLTTANASITNSMVEAATNADRTSYINFIRGLGSDGNQRKSMGDPLHSVPRLLTYKCNTFTDTELTKCSSEQQIAFVGSNEGFVHAFDTSDGVEKFAFMPQELLGNIKPLYLNAKSTTAKPRRYGMDNSVVLWVNDVNGNGVIYGGRTSKTDRTALSSTTPNPGEFVYAYATMGRGGRNLYSLDVTDFVNPQMRWFIKGGETTGFSRLGQTWSTPALTTIDINGTATKVLIMGGGYDANQDEVKRRTTDAMGNAIYIVNADTGALIWSASSTSGHTMQLNKMQYSIPSSIRVIDINNDGKADQFFVGDMGGQVWRFFINNGNSASSLISPVKGSGSGVPGADDGVFASVVSADTGTETATQLEQKNRRFYNEPSVALLNVNGTRTMVVSIGSGHRGHPLNKITKDRFYSFRTPLIYNPNPSTSAGNTHTTLTESSLYDATNNLVQEGSSTQQQTADAAFAQSSGGWYISLSDSGEKVLAEAATFAGQVVFTTYEPVANQNSCRAAQGVSRAYTVSLYDATPAAENVTGTPDKSDRYTVLKTSGIPPKPVFLLPGGGDSGGNGGDDDENGSAGPWVMCIGTVCKTVKGPYQESTYWIDES